MNQIDPMAAKYASLTPYNYSFNNPVTFTDPSGAEPPQTINHSAFYNQYYIGYTYDDRVDYTGLGDPVCAHCWRTGHSLKLYQVIAGYSTFSMGPGWKPGQSGLTPIISQWAPDFGGPVYLGMGPDGRAIHALPSQIARGATREYLWNPWAGKAVKQNNGVVTYEGGWVKYDKDLAAKIASKGYEVITIQSRLKLAPGPLLASSEGVAAWMLAGQGQNGPLRLKDASVNDIMRAFRDVFNATRNGAYRMSDFFDETGVSINQSAHRSEYVKTFNNGIKLVYTLGYADKRIDTVMPYYPAAKSYALGVGKGWSVDPMQAPTSYTIGRSTVNEAYPYAMTIYGTYGNNNRMATLYFSDVYAFMSFSAYVQGK